MFNNTNKIASDSCAVYDGGKIDSIIIAQFKRIGADEGMFSGKNVVIKPNLVIKYDSARAATTHPSIVAAAAKAAFHFGASSVIIAESPGGPYSESGMRSIYKICGMNEAAAESGAQLNFDMGYVNMSAPDGAVSKSFNIIKPIADADVIIDVAKLKTHSFTMMTAAVKNFFGTIPGTQKVEMHARFHDHSAFFAMLNDLCYMLCSKKTVVAIVDGVVGMEGNGPSGGSPRPIGCILSSRNPFALDLACADIIGASGRVAMLSDAVKRGYAPQSADKLDIDGEKLETFRISDYQVPISKKSSKLDMIPSFLKPRPVVNKKICVGCGDCAANCPVKTIHMIEYKTSDGKKRRRAEIDKTACIRCFCCQELCTYKAVTIHSNFFIRLLK